MKLCYFRVRSRERFVNPQLLKQLAVYKIKEAFISNPNVQTGIKTKNNHVVYDFLSENKEFENKICNILDLNLSPEEMKEFNDYFCNAMNSCSTAVYKMEYNNGKMQAIISGPEDFVESTIHGWYCK